MKNARFAALALALASAGALAQAPQPPPPAGANARRDAYRIQQAVQEVDRLGAQFGLLNENVDALAARIARLENAPSRDRELRDEIAALKAQIAEIQRAQANLKKEISDDIFNRLKKLLAAPPPAPAPAPAPGPKANGNKGAKTPPPPPPAVDKYYEVEIEAGYTLGAIAQTYKTTVKRILDANPGLKPTSLKIGQKIIVPVD